DASERMLARLPEGAAARAAARLEATPGRPLSPEVALGLYVAAARELFEEAGVLLARHATDGRPVTFDRPEVHGRFQTYRRRIHDRSDPLTFAEVLEQEDLVLDLEALSYFAHWVTPSFEGRRFDARFFLAEMPAGQEPAIDEEETTASAWLSPAEALQRAAREEIFLAPPTARTVEELAEFPSIEALFRAASERDVVAILPKVQLDPPAILLPWDPAYGATEGEGLPIDPDHPLTQTPSRVVLEGGAWVSRRAEETG
ncbi:MAG: hypothetical protein D6729_05805, partial [Deltaproteobacteria bacterium]